MNLVAAFSVLIVSTSERSKKRKALTASDVRFRSMRNFGDSGIKVTPMAKGRQTDETKICHKGNICRIE